MGQYLHTDGIQPNYFNLVRKKLKKIRKRTVIKPGEAVFLGEDHDKNALFFSCRLSNERVEEIATEAISVGREDIIDVDPDV